MEETAMCFIMQFNIVILSFPKNLIYFKIPFNLLFLLKLLSIQKSNSNSLANLAMACDQSLFYKNFL